MSSLSFSIPSFLQYFPLVEIVIVASLGDMLDKEKDCHGVLSDFSQWHANYNIPFKNTSVCKKIWYTKSVMMPNKAAGSICDFIIKLKQGES